MGIITISREFGSGGRELGRRMADLLQIPYYDKEIVTAIADKSQLDESYVSGKIEKGLVPGIPITIGRTFSYSIHAQNNATKILVARQHIIKELAKAGDCIIMGQSADIILKEYFPLNLFVYADMPSKIKRCQQRADENETFSEKELKKKIQQVDKARAKGYELVSSHPWGAKEGYHLCINTTGVEIKTLAPLIADYTKYWFKMEKL